MGKNNILAITSNHDTGIAYYNSEEEGKFDGNNIFCINEERLNREKLTRRFPLLSVDVVRSRYAVRKFDLVLVASRYTPLFFLKLLNKWYSKISHEDPFSLLLHGYILVHAIIYKFTFLQFFEEMATKIFYAKLLRVAAKDICLIDHHYSHAAAAYYASSFPQALIFTVDLMGDYLSITVNEGKGTSLRTLTRQSALNGIGAFYGKITHLLGFRANRHEGKVVGLAAYGRCDKELLEVFESICRFDQSTGVFSKVNYFYDFYKTHIAFKAVKNKAREDVAATAQYYLEEQIERFVSYWVRKTGMTNVCCAGGVFANVKLNQRLHEIEQVEKIFIFPHMGDGGLAFGALMSYLKPKPFAMKNIYLGFGYTTEEVEIILKKKNITYEYCYSIEEKIAQLLSTGKTVGRFDGNLEFGPRALGNRSILSQATDHSVNDWLNKKLKRTEFMPFAPLVLGEYADKCFKNISGAEYTAKFMTITFDCTDYMKKTCPGVVHIDGTARPQFIREEDNKSCYMILKAYYELTQIPAIINTSFNVHEEPIVCTPEEAIDTFYESSLDVLAIDKFIVISQNTK